MHRVPCFAGPSRLTAVTHRLRYGDVLSPLRSLGAVRHRSGTKPRKSKHQRGQDYELTRATQMQKAFAATSMDIVGETQRILQTYITHQEDKTIRKWRHEKGTRREELKFINQLLQQTKTPMSTPTSSEEIHQPSIVEEAAVDFGEADGVPPGVDLGALVALNRGTVRRLGIVVGDLHNEQGYSISTFTHVGQVENHTPSDIMFVIPNVIDKDLVSRCGTTDSPTESQHIMARVLVLRRLREISIEVERMSSRLAPHISDLHSHFCHSEPDTWTTVTLDQVADLVLPKKRTRSWSTTIAMLSLSELLVARAQEFLVPRSGYCERQLLHVRPKSQVERLQNVRDMMTRRASDPRLRAFTEKAQRLIPKNRAIRTESEDEMPSVTSMETEAFTDDDRMIIQFLKDSLYPIRGVQVNPYSALISGMVKSLGDIYEGEVNNEQVHQLLVELGVYAPWQDYVSTRLEFDLDQEPEETSSRVKKAQEVLRRGMESRATQTSDSALLGPEDLYPHDRLESIRHDFGDLPAYIIDDYEAEELDDAVSVESIPGEPNNLWIHTHIADPTRLLPPTHVFSQAARRHGETMYFMHRTWPMLPRSLLEQSLSLGDATAQGKPEPTLTFSTKIDENGEIVDYKVRAGLLRNVRIARYDDVDHTMGYDLGPVDRAYPLGGPTHSKTGPKVLDFSPQDRENFRLFMVFRDRMRARTRRLPVAFFTMPQTESSLRPKPLPPSNLELQHPTPFRGFPDVTYTIFLSQERVGSRGIVGDAAQVACRVASKYCLDKGIPVIRRTTPPPLVLFDTDLQKLLDMKDQDSCVPFWEAAKMHARLMAASPSLEPLEHWALGVPNGEGYTRVTSPLRRYHDLLAHWQIKESLLNDAGLGSGSGKPIYSTDELKEYLVGDRFDDLNRKRLQSQHSQYWDLLALKRWLQKQPEGLDALGVLEARPLAPPKADKLTAEKVQMVALPSLGLTAYLVEKGPLMTPPGEPVGVKIHRIIVGATSRLFVALA